MTNATSLFLQTVRSNEEKMELGWIKYLIPGEVKNAERELLILKQRKDALNGERAANRVRFIPTDSEQHILEALHPLVATKALDTLQDATHDGLFVLLFCGLRTFLESEALYKQGRDAAGNIINIKDVVTRAKPGYSWHNYSLAIDIVMNVGPRIHIHPTWDDFVDHNKDTVNDWKTLGEIGKSHGFFWGGDFKSLVDVPHFEYHTGIASTSDALSMYNHSGMNAVWAQIK
jgi:peptidoglycan L-alanyl-D-glutamate endopeptidase CwlK